MAVNRTIVHVFQCLKSSVIYAKMEIQIIMMSAPYAREVALKGKMQPNGYTVVNVCFGITFPVQEFLPNSLITSVKICHLNGTARNVRKMVKCKTTHLFGEAIQEKIQSVMSLM